MINRIYFNINCALTDELLINLVNSPKQTSYVIMWYKNKPEISNPEIINMIRMSQGV